MGGASLYGILSESGKCSGSDYQIDEEDKSDTSSEFATNYQKSRIRVTGIENRNCLITQRPFRREFGRRGRQPDLECEKDVV